MPDHAPHKVQRICDVAIIGGSLAGLAAALQLGRQRRSVIVLDAGEPRNALAAHMHSYLGREGVAPSELIGSAREEVRSYGVEVTAGRVSSVSRDGAQRFLVELAGGDSILARRVLAATGLVDELPAIEGLLDHWGGDVAHCPFCHGYEMRDLQIVQVVTHPTGLHSAPLLRQLSATLTIVLHEAGEVDASRIDALRDAGVRVVEQSVRRILTGADGRLVAVELAGQERIAADAVFLAPQFKARVEPLLALGLRAVAHPSGLGDFLETDATGATAVEGVYAAGNVTDAGQQALQAAANGSWVGATISVSLAEEDLEGAARASANEADWDHRYSGDQLWSGNPNGTLMSETQELVPGRALDVGAGEGGDALWLAEQGWAVTATDISHRALGRVGSEATRRGLRVDCLHADANALHPFEVEAFDLVCAQYASIPRTPDGRAIANMLRSVAPGGTLLVVSHDFEAMRTPVDASARSRPFDPDAYVRVEDFIGPLSESQEWRIETHETRPRPAGAASASHHVDDVVLRARRESA